MKDLGLPRRTKIILIEPDLTNIVAAKQNNVEGDIEFRQIGVGNSSGRGDLVDLGLGNNAFRVSLAKTGEILISSISEILTEFDTAKFCPFIIKIDVEGSEKELFAQNTEWIELFPLLIIELHDWLVPRNGVAQNFLRAISKLDRDFVCFGEDVFSISNKLLGK